MSQYEVLVFPGFDEELEMLDLLGRHISAKGRREDVALRLTITPPPRVS